MGAGNANRLKAAGALAAGALALFGAYFFVLAPWRAAAIVRSAEARMRMGFYAEALADSERAIRLRGSVAAAHAVRAYCMGFGTGGLKAVEDEADLAVSMDPWDALATRVRAEVRIWRERYSDALDDAERAVRLDPLGDLALVARGGARSLCGLEEGVADAEQALALNHYGSSAILLRSSARTSLSPVAALRDASAVVELYPLWSPGYRARAQRYDALLKWKEAHADAERAVRLDPGSDSLVVRGELRLERYWYEEARKDAEAAVAANPRSVSALLFRSRVSVAEGGDAKAALADCTAALELNPGSVAAYFARSGVYAHFGPSTEAAQDAQHATSLAPKVAWALLARAAVLDELGKDAEALADYDEACRLNPKSVSARIQRCIALVNHGKDRQGLDEADDVLKNLDPTSLQGLMARAYARIRSRDIETVKAAVQDCTLAHQAAPDHEDPLRERSDAWHALAFLYEDQRKPAEAGQANTPEEQAYSHATDDIKDAKERNERSPIVRVFEGSLLLSIGKGKERKKATAAAEQYYKRAKEAFEEARRRNPNYLYALLSLAQAESLLGENPGALRTCEEARGKYPNRFDAYETLANIEFGLVEKAFDANQALAGADERRGHLEKALGQFEEARKRAADSNAVRIDRSIRYVKLWQDLFEATVLYFQKDYSSSRRRLRQADQALEEFPQQKAWRDSLDGPLRRVGQ